MGEKAVELFERCFSPSTPASLIIILDSLPKGLQQPRHLCWCTLTDAWRNWDFQRHEIFRRVVAIPDYCVCPVPSPSWTGLSRSFGYPRTVHHREQIGGSSLLPVVSRCVPGVMLPLVDAWTCQHWIIPLLKVSNQLCLCFT